MRILMLNYEFPPLGGGASPVSFEIAKGYANLGHKVDVVTMRYKNLPPFEHKEGINIYRVKCWRRKKEICHPWEQLTYVISARSFLKKYLKGNFYDICHCHFIIPTGIVALWLKKKFNTSYIITAHGSDVPGHNPDRFRFLHKFTKPILKKICRSAKLITLPSEYLKDLVKKEIGNYEIRVVLNGSRDFYQNGIEKENIIISAGRLLEGKGFQFLIKAFNELNKNNWKLYVIGDGPYKSKLIELAQGNANTVFTGWLDNTGDEYRLLLNKAKIFSLLSSRESQGVVFLEAMSAKCAILSSNITACRETVTEDIGFLVNGKNIEEIKEKLNEMMMGEDRLKEFMNNARKRYEEKYTYPEIVSQYINLL